MGWTPDLTVAAIIKREQTFLLVEERIGNALVLNQPAGHVERNESLLAAVVREVREETAWRFTPEALVGIYTWRNPRSGRSTLRFAFSGTVDDHDADQPLDPPVIATHWLSRAQIQSQPQRLRTPMVLRCIDDYLAGQRFALSAIAAVAEP